MKNIYRIALDIQDASNPSGVVNTLANEIMPAIREETGYREHGTSYMRNHPAFILLLDKLVSLSTAGYINDTDSNAISQAYRLCNERAVDPNWDRVEARMVHNCKSAPCHVCGSLDGTGLPMSEARS